MIKKIIPPLILLLFSLFGLKALFQGPLYSAHDIWHNIARFHHYYQALKDGQFPPYWIANMAYNHGYPLFFFSYPLPWIIGSVFLEFGLDLPAAFKLLVFLAFFAAGYFMYLLVAKVTKDKLAAIVSAILYLFAPYHFLTVFVSSAVGTLFIYMLLPLFVLGIYLIISGRLKPGIILTSVSASGLILSHLPTIVFILPVMLFTAAGFIKNNPENNYRLTFIGFVISGVLTGLISAFYLIPAVAYTRYTAISDIGGFLDLHKNNFVNFSQLIYSKWGSGPITAYARDGEISFQVGIAQWLSILGLGVLVIIRKQGRFLNSAVLAGFALTIFLMLDFSGLIWDLLVKVIAVDYPFRSLLSSVFFASLAGGLILNAVKNNRVKLWIAVFLIVTAVYTNRNHTKVILYIENSYMDFVVSEVTTNTFNEYRPAKSSPLFKSEARPQVSENVRLLNTYQNTFETNWEIEASESGQVFVGQLGFPGQTLYVDGRQRDYRTDHFGRITFETDQGIHNVKVVFERTKIILISKLLSVLGLLALGFIFWQKRYIK